MRSSRDPWPIARRRRRLSWPRPLALAALGAALALGLPSGTVRAADLASPIEVGSLDLASLLDLSVEAVTRRSERASQAPAAVFVVTDEDIRRHGFRTLQEVLGSVPGLFAYPGRFPQVGVRGMGVLGDFTSRLLVLVDGHSLANPVGVDLGRGLPVPLSAVKRVEVIKGPVGSVYGPTAFFGVVNVVTTGGGGEVWAGLEAAQGRVFAGEASGAVRGAAGEADGLAAFGVFGSSGRDWTFPELAGLTEGPGGLVRRVDFGDGGSAYLRGRWRDLTASAACGHAYGGILVTNHADPRSVLESLTCFAEVRHRLRLSDQLTLEPRLAYDAFHVRAGYVSPEPPLGVGLFADRGDMRWLTAELRGDWRPTAALRVDLGATLQLNGASHHSSASAIPTLARRWDDQFATVNSWASAELALGHGLTFHGALTWFEHALFGGRLTPKLALVWQPTPSDTVKAIWAEGFRPPVIVEAFIDDGYLIASNRDLRPETVSSGELVYEHRFGHLAVASGSLFWNQYRDLIHNRAIQVTSGAIFDFQQQAFNAGGRRVRGGELALTLRWGDWLRAYGGLSAQETDGADLANFPEVTANLALSTRAPWRPLTLSVRGSAIAARRTDIPVLLGGQAGVTPASLSLGAHASLEVPGVRGLALELAVQNILDERNASPAPGDWAPVLAVQEAPRTVRADIRYSF